MENQLHRTPYGKHIKVTLDTGTEGGAKQSFKDECDINNILKRYAKTGVIEHIQEHTAQFGSAPTITYQDAMNIVTTTNSMFENLPSKIRNRFQNNPTELLQFINNENNRDEAIELGLINKVKHNERQKRSKDNGNIPSRDNELDRRNQESTPTHEESSEEKRTEKTTPPTRQTQRE